MKDNKSIISLNNPSPARWASSPTRGEGNGTRGFTLIELLVVVLIIGILAAVAVPQYQKAVERSKATEAMSLLKSVVQAYQAHYLANGQWATRFDQLDVDIPWTGNTKFLSTFTDAKSNKDWSLGIELYGEYVILRVGRIDGKYKGANFQVAFDNPGHSVKRVLMQCSERKTGVFIFDTDLPEGAYCEKVMQGKFSNSDDYSRSYHLA